MQTYRATATNDKGETFAFTFQHTNWNGIHASAQARLDVIVEGDALHRKLGPWRPINIDRGYP